MKMEFFQNELETMTKLLNIPEEVREKLTQGNWRKLLLEAGAETWDERRRVHDDEDPKLRELPLVVPGAQIAVVSTSPDGEKVTLVQVRNNGETDESKKEIGFPGGASIMWSYNGNTVIEHPIITGYREFQEEVGTQLNYPVSYLCYTCTTNSYDKFPDAYAPSMYYLSTVAYDDIKKMAAAGGSEEGRIMLVPVKELHKYHWFPNAVAAFQMIIQQYYN